MSAYTPDLSIPEPDLQPPDDDDRLTRAQEAGHESVRPEVEAIIADLRRLGEQSACEGASAYLHGLPDDEYVDGRHFENEAIRDAILALLEGYPVKEMTDMTIEERCLKYLESNGMFPEDARTVVDCAKEEECNESMKDRWSDDTEGYPIQLLAVVIAGIKLNAVEWIDANCPNAWYRPMFAGGVIGEQGEPTP